MSAPRFVVAGAGPAGLSLAIALRLRGADVTVIERRSRESFISNAGGAYELPERTLAHFRALGVLDAVLAHGTMLSRFSLETFEGTVLKALDFEASKLPVFAITRAALQRALLAKWGALDGAVVHDDEIVSVVSSEERVRVHLSAGAAIDASMLFGADGIRSSVRRLCFDERPPEDVGIAALWGRAALGSFPMKFAHARGFLGRGRSLVLGHTGTVDDPELRFTVCVRTEARAIDRAAVFATMPSALAPMLGTAYDVAETRLFAQPPLSAYVRGRVVLLGDAAHGMPPFLGLGASSAVEDAVLLAEAAFDANPVAAVRSVGTARHRALAPRIPEARRLGALMHATSALGHGAFGLVTRLVPTRAVIARMRADGAPT